MKIYDDRKKINSNIYIFLLSEKKNCQNCQLQGNISDFFRHLTNVLHTSDANIVKTSMIILHFYNLFKRCLYKVFDV